MNQQDKQRVENICKVFQVLPDSKREYLTGVADGMAAMAAGGLEHLPAQPRPVPERDSA